MLAIASQIILCLVLAALLGLIIGYLLGKSNCPKATYKTAPVHDPHTEDDGDCQDDGENDEAPDTDNDGAADAAQEAEPEALLSTEEASDDAEASPEKTDEENTSAAQGLLSTETEATASIAKQAVAVVESDQDNAPDEAAASSSDDDQKADTAADDASGEEESGDTTGNEENDVLETEPAEEDRPETLLSAPEADHPKDDLKRIKGIGVKIEALLNEIGVYYFEQIAAWTEKEAAWIDHKVSFPGRALRDDWIGQAKLLAAGGETEFSKRVDAGEVPSSKKG